MQLTRKELYDLVWSEAMTTICKRYGLSDNGLRKHCRTMNIPTPPLGYWAKLQHGKTVERIPLPDDYEGKKKEVSLREIDPKDIVVEIDKPIDPQNSASRRFGRAISPVSLPPRFCTPKIR